VLTDLYVREKLRELEAGRRVPPRPRSTATPLMGPLARTAGRALRWVGEGLESWSAPTPTVPESDGARPGATRQTAGSRLSAADGQREGC
jgi:hypothetical protein